MLSLLSQKAAIRVVLMQEDALEITSHVLRPAPVNDEVDDPLGDGLASTHAMYSAMNSCAMNSVIHKLAASSASLFACLSTLLLWWVEHLRLIVDASLSTDHQPSDCDGVLWMQWCS